jgi:hypothetical protein
MWCDWDPFCPHVHLLQSGCGLLSGYTWITSFQISKKLQTPFRSTELVKSHSFGWTLSFASIRYNSLNKYSFLECPSIFITQFQWARSPPYTDYFCPLPPKLFYRIRILHFAIIVKSCGSYDRSFREITKSVRLSQNLLEAVSSDR